jgi:diguanylate cyclase (GGDEF)-like protein
LYQLERSGYPLIDHFKLVNDRHGHQVGDAVLREFSGSLAGAFRQDVDWIARYGGEEFVICLPETGLDGARCAAERFRRGVESLVITVEGKKLGITASFGIAGLEEDGGAPIATADDLVQAADGRLYAAKEGGRNRVEEVGLGHSPREFPERPS